MAIRPNPILPAGAVASIDRLLAGQMADTCVIRRPSGARGASGAPSGAETTVATAPCLVRVPGRAPTEAVAGGRYGPQADYEVVVPRGTDVRSSDTIAVNGRTLDVIFAPLASSFGFTLTVAAKATS